MCGRFALDQDTPAIEKRFTAQISFSADTRHYNIAPGMHVPIIVRNSPKKAILARWGLIPFWAKDPRIGYKMINVRAEGIESKPAFRKPLKTSRCLVPTTGFFEWKHLDREKIPYFIHLKDDNLFAFAGLYDEWKDAEGKILTTFTIITTSPNTMMEKIHNRMPVIFSQKEEDLWLDPAQTDIHKLVSLLDPYPASDMEAHPVSKTVNNPDNDTPDIIHPA